MIHVKKHNRNIASLVRSKSGAVLIGQAYAKVNILRILRAPKSKQRALEKILTGEGYRSTHIPGMPNDGFKSLDAFYSPGEIERMASFVEGGDSAASIRRTLQTSSKDTYNYYNEDSPL